MTKLFLFARIYNCHVYNRGVKMKNDNYIFNLIKNGEFDIIEQLMEKGKIDVNIVDGVGNDVVMKLLKLKKYDLVMSLMKKRSWNVNKQNYEGDTFGHILAQDNSMNAIKVMDELKKNKKYLPNIKNNKGETALDKAINNNYLAYAFKILEDERFDSIDVDSFKNLFSMCISKNYGKYSIIKNLETMINSLENKTLSVTLRQIVTDLSDNFSLIKEEILKNNRYVLKAIVGI